MNPTRLSPGLFARLQSSASRLCCLGLASTLFTVGFPADSYAGNIVDETVFDAGSGKTPESFGYYHYFWSQDTGPWDISQHSLRNPVHISVNNPVIHSFDPVALTKLGQSVTLSFSFRSLGNLQGSLSVGLWNLKEPMVGNVTPPDPVPIKGRPGISLDQELIPGADLFIRANDKQIGKQYSEDLGTGQEIAIVLRIERTKDGLRVSGKIGNTEIGPVDSLADAPEDFVFNALSLHTPLLEVEKFTYFTDVKVEVAP